MWKWLRWGIFRQEWKEMSMGEFIDKLAILKVKVKKIGGHELNRQVFDMEKQFYPYLVDHLDKCDIDEAVNLFCILIENHMKQWDFEDGVFGATEPEEGVMFAKLSREYNMKRAAIKKQIDILFGEKYLEVKKYTKLKELE